ncbi:NUDIX domain-containing protein [Ktedonosporobacter rubrisoli]|uniref:NUDIX domain-containing protein n=1 Tax=Ktedonosporobacter rubrisoli TaxID=2509675 RepID=A0A4P6JXG9_KTERU|nr:NUDIX domain-containing protein [Ktedonosporobacter rubrisoli]QBD80448.1 NUDIX domain-containing protein [Ktedonosporobacter rubrisoli]
MPEHQDRPLVGVSVLINKGDRFLMIKRNQKVHGAGTWTVPGGHLEFGESFAERAEREAKEETGVEITNVKFRVITNDVFQAEHKHYVTVWMEAQYVSGEPHVDAPYEETEVGWFTWDSLPEPLFLPFQHLLTGETFPSQTTQDRVGSAINMPHRPE